MGMEVAEQKLHVLAVDDSLLDRKLIERLLRTSSYQVTTVNSGIEALEFLGFQEDKQLQDVNVNLIITDYCMPGMTGYDLLKKVKESSSLRNIPVVIMSSENVSSRINSCLEEGAKEFLIKPVRLSDVKKLRPHMLKSKCGEEKKQEKQEDDVDNHLQMAEQQNTEAQQQQQKPPHKQQLNSNKRKSLDEGITADRSRPRCSGLTVA